MNLRTRFVLISAGLMFVLATCMSIGAYRIASSQLENQVNSSLDQRASRILVIMSQPSRISTVACYGQRQITIHRWKTNSSI